MEVNAEQGLEVIQVKYGERMTRMSDAFPDFPSYGEPDQQLLMDYNFWVLRRSGETILLDTGYDISRHDWLHEVETTSPPTALAALNIDPIAVSTVIASHFHYDHIGFIHLFPNARVVAAQAEYDFWAGQRDAAQDIETHFAVAADLDEIERTKSEGRLVLVSEGPTEVCPGVTVYPVGGHSPGQLITLVQGRTGPLILTSDAAHLYEQVQRGWPFFAHSDRGQMEAAYVFINDLAQRTGAAVVPGHDSRVRDAYPPHAGSAGTFATALTPALVRTHEFKGAVQ